MAYTPYLLPLLASVLVMTGVGVYAGRFRQMPAAIPFSLAIFLSALWALTYGLDVASLSLPAKLFWMKARFLPIALLPVAWLAVAMRYTGQARSRSWWARWLIIPLITILLAWTSDAQTLFRSHYRLDVAGPFPRLAFDNGPWFWAHLLYSYAVNLYTFSLLIRSLRGANRVWYRRTLIVIASTLLPVSVDMLAVLGFTPLPDYNLAPSLFGVTGLVMAWALFRYRILDVVPVARSAVMASLADPVLVFDTFDHLVDFNPAARPMLSEAGGQPLGQPAARVLAAAPELLRQYQAAPSGEIEFAWGPPERRRVYAATVTGILQEAGAPAGRLILLRDVTAQAQLIDQLREYEARFRHLNNNVPFPLVITRLSDNALLYLNQAAQTLFGLPQEAAQDRLTSDFYVEPADQARFLTELQATGTAHNFETRLRRQDGQPFWALLSGALTTFGAEPVLLAGVNDITRRKAAEEAEREQRALAEALRDTAATLATTLSFDETLEQVLLNVGRVVPHDAANIALIDERQYTYIAYARGYAEHGLAEAEIRALRLPVAGTPYFQQMLTTGRPVLVSDIQTDPLWVPIDATRWIRSYAGMPIRLKRQVVGFLSLDSMTPGFFTPAHIDRLGAFADQAAAAVEGARLYDEVRRRAEELAVLNQISQAISSDLDLQPVLKTLLQECQRVLPMDAFYVALYDAATGVIDHPLFYDQGEYHVVEPRLIQVQPGLSGKVILSRQTLSVADLADEAALRAHPRVVPGGQPTRAYVGVPLIARGEVMGVLSMQSYTPAAYTPDQVRLLETIAAEAAIVVQNVRLYAAAQAELSERRQAEASLREANDRLQVQLATIASLQASLREQAIRDPLTGLFNRRYLRESLVRELARAARAGDPVCLVMIDLDHFKQLNDTRGHAAGDLVLQALAELLLHHTRQSDIVCRYGGEEFVVVLPAMPLATAQARVELWRASFAALAVAHADGPLRATLSAGLAAFPEHGVSDEALLGAADKALYAAKAAGRNCTVVWGRSGELGDDALQRVEA